MNSETINPFLGLDPKDVLRVTSSLVDFPSFSRQEKELCDSLQEWIGNYRSDAVFTRISNTLIVQVNKVEDKFSELPILLAGHLDTVPCAQFEGQTNDKARLVGDKLYGLGTADMKSGVAVMLALLADISVPATFVFYEAEEIAEKYNGLRLVAEENPDLIKAKWAILLEPTNGQLEMGCQGALTAHARFFGKKAHSARPWMGDNAIHKCVKVLDRAVQESKAQVEVEVEGLTYTPTVQVTMIEGGVAANVIPDVIDITINHRFAPDVSEADASEFIVDICKGADEVEITSISAGAVPAMEHPLVDFAKSKGRTLVPKVAWTDVARFYKLGVLAVNCGPGDPTLCHTPHEHIEVSKLQETYKFLTEFIGGLARQKG